MPGWKVEIITFSATVCLSLVLAADAVAAAKCLLHDLAAAALRMFLVRAAAAAEVCLFHARAAAAMWLLFVRATAVTVCLSQQCVCFMLAPSRPLPKALDAINAVGWACVSGLYSTPPMLLLQQSVTLPPPSTRACLSLRQATIGWPLRRCLTPTGGQAAALRRQCFLCRRGSADVPHTLSNTPPCLPVPH